MSLCQSYFSC